MLNLVPFALIMQKNLLGVWHKINGEQLQKHLDEFVYN